MIKSDEDFFEAVGKAGTLTQTERNDLRSMLSSSTFQKATKEVLNQTDYWKDQMLACNLDAPEGLSRAKQLQTQIRIFATVFGALVNVALDPSEEEEAAQ